MPESVLDDIKSVAQRALFSTPSDTTPVTKLSSSQQASNKPFVIFFNCLWEAVTWQVEDTGSQKGMLRTLAMENTSERCQAVL